MDNNYNIDSFSLDFETARTLYYKGVAIKIQSWFVDHDSIVIHFDRSTSILFNGLLVGYAKKYEIDVNHVNFTIDAKGEAPS